MQVKGTIVLVLLLVFLPRAVHAVNLNGESRMYLQSRETADDHHLFPLYEYVDLTLDELAGEELSFHLGGWARQDLTHSQSFDNRSFNGDLQYAYLDFRKENNNTILNLGRVPVYEGVASEQVDGLSARTDLRGGFGISAYGGIPVESDFDDRSGDTIFGGRVSREVADLYRVGISYLTERNNSRDFRTEAGLDLRVRPHDKVEIYGRSTYNGETHGWMEHSYYFSGAPFEKFRFSMEITSTNYADYFASVDTVTTGIFELRPGIVDAKEKLLLLGGQAAYTLRDNLIITADYKSYDYRVVDSADYYGGRLNYTRTDTSGGGVSFYRMDGPTGQRRYFESRVYGYKGFGKADLTVDLFNVSYDEKISGVKNAYAVSVALGYNLTDNARLAADFDYSHNPTFDTDIRGFIKFIYGVGSSYEM